MPYDPAFFDGHLARSASSAAAIVPLTLGLVDAHSVVDVGCGVGAWLAEFARRGVPDVLGIDGPWVDPARLLIPRDRFVVADLASNVPAPRTFDLAMSVEVAEHLPASAADRFVASLVALAPVVLFSAAIPMQGGTDHVNEQWPGYWAERFARHGYAAIDCIRPRVWNDPSVAWWYAQNTVVYASDAALARHPRLTAARSVAPKDVLPLVHPGCLAARVGAPIGLRRMLRELPATVMAAVRGAASRAARSQHG